MTERYDVTARETEYTEQVNERITGYSDAISRLCEIVHELIDCDFRDFVAQGNDFDVSLRFVCTHDDNSMITVNVVRTDNDDSDECASQVIEIARIDPVQKIIEKTG